MTAVINEPRVSEAPDEGAPKNVYVRPPVSVVVPTFNERNNVGPLLAQLAAVLPARSEVIIVDDGTDDTPQAARVAARRTGLDLRVRRRVQAEGGLGGAVVEGFSMARGEWTVVMDADLQHPPALVAELVAAGERTGADAVVASRYAVGGDTGGLANRYRQLVSRASTWLARAVFPMTLRRVSDPMSGFFALRTAAVQRAALRPDGYKILLECLVRMRPSTVVEVPFEFGERFAGESKSSLKQGLRFLRHVATLRASSALVAAVARARETWATLRREVPARVTPRVLALTAVASVGVLTNLAAMQLLVVQGGMHYLAAAVLANQFAVAASFLLTDVVGIGGSHDGPEPPAGRLARFGRFALSNNVELVARLPMLAVLVGGFAVGHLVATALTLAAMFALRYFVLDRLTHVGEPERSSALEAI